MLDGRWKPGQAAQVIGLLDASPAAIASDATHGRVGMVLLTANRFELWTLPAKGN